MLKDLSDDLIENAIQNIQTLTLDDFPYHSQSLERHVKLVTEAASAFGEVRRDGCIRAKLLSKTYILFVYFILLKKKKLEYIGLLIQYDCSIYIKVHFTQLHSFKLTNKLHYSNRSKKST